MFRSSHFSFSFLVPGHFWQRSYKNAKILRNLCFQFARQKKNEKKITQLNWQKYQKTKIWDEWNNEHGVEGILNQSTDFIVPNKRKEKNDGNCSWHYFRKLWNVKFILDFSENQSPFEMKLTYPKTKHSRVLSGLKCQPKNNLCHQSAWFKMKAMAIWDVKFSNGG